MDGLLTSPPVYFRIETRHHQPDGDARLQTRLKQVAPASWRQVRQETRDHHQEQLNRYRFRHRPLTYLETLEARWEQASCT